MREELQASIKLISNNLYEDVLSAEISNEFREFIIKEEKNKLKEKVENIIAFLTFSSIIVFFIFGFVTAWEYVGYAILAWGIFCGLGLLCYYGIPTLGLRYILHERIKDLILKDKELEKIHTKYPEIFDLVENNYNEIVEETFYENFLVTLMTNIFVEIILENESELLQDKIKHKLLIITKKNFVMEALNLTEFIVNETLLTSINRIIEEVKIALIDYLDNPSDLKYITNQFNQFFESIEDLDAIISSLIKVQKDKPLEKRLSSDAQSLKEQIESKPLPKSQIKIDRAPKGLTKERTLSTISVLDNEIIEIRTKAGTYFALVNQLKKEGEREVRKLELLTDKELEVKIEVIKSTLEVLEKERSSLTKKEFDEIKDSYYSELIRAEQVLNKRKESSSSKIICPFCQTKNSPISKKCKSCKNDLPYCIVCLNSIGVGEEISICPSCSSVAHSEHFEQWLENSETCPYCKHNIKKKLEKIKMESASKISS